MTMQTRLPAIDADAHVIETERTWDYLEPSEQRFRPRQEQPNSERNEHEIDPPEQGRPPGQAWLRLG